MERYPRRSNGDEYYPRGRVGFRVDAHGEHYARDRKGNQLYPPWTRPVFARNEEGKEYYAQDAKGNERYPVVKGRSVLIQTRHSVQIARDADGTEKYPHDAKGNEYYLRDKGVPYLMRKSNGEPYLARGRQGNVIIPWNYFNEFSTEDHPYAPTKDGAGNTVYYDQSNLSLLTQLIVKCLCHVVIICPAAVSALAVFV